MHLGEEGTFGARRLLRHAWAYNLLQVALGSNRSHKQIVRDYVKPTSGDRILDLGCGPGHILEALPTDIEYIGVDLHADYIATARRHWAQRGMFLEADVRQPVDLDGSVDIVLVMGVLHHLDDADCAAVFENAAAALAPSGRLVAIEPAHTPRQRGIGSLLLGLDRGSNIRSPERYADQARASFEHVAVDTRTDLLRLPYAHAILDCAAPFASDRR